MYKKIFVIFGGVVVVGLGWWLISPLWRMVALNEELPGASDAPDVVTDALMTMDAETKADFETQVAKMKDVELSASEEMPASNDPVILARALMVARAHEVAGEALFVRAGSEQFLRFENLKTINGPDLRIYLSSGLGADDFVDLGPIRATEGNVNYPIPAGTDLQKYRHALIWCRAFSVLFSYAQL